jgi:glycosyltransferase involved in cell wall biosynthesis
MKLLYYVGTGSNKFGGLEKFNIQLFKKLIAAHHEVVVVYRRPIIDGAFKNFLEECNIKYRWIYDSFAITGESKLTNAKRLASIVSEEKPDLIHYNFGNLYDIALTRFRNPLLHYKAIYTAHCHVNLKRRYLRMVFSALTPFVKKVLCVSNAITNEFSRHLKFAKAQTLYLGVPENTCNRDECRSLLGFSNDEFIICNIAYHDPIKGVDILIKAVDYLKSNSGWRFSVQENIFSTQRAIRFSGYFRLFRNMGTEK